MISNQDMSSGLSDFILVNGIQTTQLSVFDRAVSYGDGLFETIRACSNMLPLWPLHKERLKLGCERLQIELTNDDIKALENNVSQLNQHSPSTDGVVKIIISRGISQRGYQYSNAILSTRVVSWSPLPDIPEDYYLTGINAIICNTRLSLNPMLAGIKHLNRLEQVLATAEWQYLPDVAEGIMLDREGNVIAGTAGNIFIITKNGEFMTPCLDQAGVKGVMREFIFHICQQENISCIVKSLSLVELLDAKEIFLCNSIRGILPVCMMNNQAYTVGDMTRMLQSKIKQLFTSNE